MDMKMLIRGSKLLVGHVHILSTSILYKFNSGIGWKLYFLTRKARDHRGLYSNCCECKQARRLRLHLQSSLHGRVVFSHYKVYVYKVSWAI